MPSQSRSCPTPAPPLNAGSSVVVVGASLAGVHAAGSLRARGFDGRLTVVGDEPHRPYDRPPLSKQLLRGEWGAEQVSLPQAGALESVEWRLGVAATALDVERRHLHLGDGSELDFDGLVIATGARPRTLDAGGREGVHALRTLDDGLALADELRGTPGRVVVAGGGFIGTEIAASCRALGLEVTVLEALDAPLAGVLGSAAGGRLAAVHRAHGVDLRTGVSVTEIRGGQRVEAVGLSDGTSLAADVLVVAIGVAPAVEWLAGSGLRLDDGILCDETCLAAPGIVAAGDVARWPNRRFDELRRVEHWDNAIRQAEHAAGRLLGDEPSVPYQPIPWVWSDQYDLKLQLVGSPAPHDEVVLRGEGDRWLATYRRGDRPVAAFGVNRTRSVMRMRKAMEEGAEWEEAVGESAPEP